MHFYQPVASVLLITKFLLSGVKNVMSAVGFRHVLITVHALGIAPRSHSDCSGPSEITCSLRISSRLSQKAQDFNLIFVSVLIR